MTSNDELVIIRSSQTTIPTDTSTSFTIQFPLPLKGKYRLEKVRITYSMYNINSINNLIYLTDTGGAHIITIPPGYYTPSTLATAIATAMTNGGSQAYTCVINSGSNTLTITAAGNFSFTFKTNTATSLANVMGFGNVNTSSATSQTGTYPVNVDTYDSFNILIGSSQPIRDVNGGISTFNIPINAIPQQVIFYEPQVNYQYASFQNSTSNIKVVVNDSSGNQIGGANGLNNVNWFMVLHRVYEQDHFDPHGPNIKPSSAV
jgi:hypothetical protein